MRLAAISLLVLLAWGIEEPEPISEEERQDEVAQAQKRAGLLACLMLAWQVTVENVADLEPVLETSKHPRDSSLRKIKADLLWKCNQGVTNSLADEMLSGIIDLANPTISSFLEVDKAALQNPDQDIAPTAEQLVLFKTIQFEANRTDDGFEQPPPIVDDFTPSVFGSINELGISDTVMNGALVTGVVVFLGLLFVCKP